MYQSRKELERLFQTEGSFYKLNVRGEIQICRSLAVIRRKGSVQKDMDALFVLLNPGKSLPVAGEDSIPKLSGAISQLPLLPATADNTLYQLMRLMERMNWNAVQVINLTDLRTGKFEEYKEKQEFMEIQGDRRHSIFSVERFYELLERLEVKDAVIAGWGTKSAIAPVAEEAYAILSKMVYVSGLTYKVHPLYYHPFPWIQEKCLKWLDGMEEQLKKREEELRRNMKISV